jgi:hypothetical protein
MRFWRIVKYGIVFLVFIIVWAFLIGFSSNRPGSYFNKGKNAVWIEHAWVGDFKTDVEIQNLVNTLNKYDFGVVFVHVGPLKSDGSIDPETYQYSIHFVDTFRKFDKDIQLQAWMGQLRWKIDLDDPQVRHNVVKKSIIMTQLVGFDGIHFDIEPVWDEDEGFIKLLEETRSAIPEEKVISVAMAKFLPKSLIWFLQNLREFENYSTHINYTNVAKYADQIAVMVYDTSITKEWLYRLVVREQTIWVTSLLKDTDVFIGIPSYEYEQIRPWFNHEVENVENGLKGIISGLNNLRSNVDNFAGVAIYPYWEIDQEEWDVYQELWLK